MGEWLDDDDHDLDDDHGVEDVDNVDDDNLPWVAPALGQP